jgi:chromate reductase
VIWNGYNETPRDFWRYAQSLIEHSAGAPCRTGNLYRLPARRSEPIYSADIEEAGIPVSVQTLVDLIASTDAVIISTPEYNKNISGVLKNALDWVSRTPGNPWARKPVAIMSATAGRSGGERAQNSLRLCLQPFAPRLLNGPEVLVGSAHDAFASGILINKRYQKAVGALMAALRAEVSMR